MNLKESQEYRSFSIIHDEIARQIRSEILISDGMTFNVAARGPKECGAKRYMAIWDTGATSSAITKHVVDELQLPVVSRGTTTTAAGDISTTGHIIHLWMPHKVVITHCVANCVNLGVLNVDILIGMDVITRGDFSISNYEGKTIMSFREPSMRHVDYTKTDSLAEAPPRRNAPCPCGSGKKYKHCHGR
jgi:predicted aspartyl protease